LRRRQFDGDSSGREMPTSDYACWMIRISEPTPYGPAEVVILGAWIQGVEGCLAAPLLSPLYIDGEAVSFACLSRRLTVAREMR
jgi:hypothetical protein